MKIEPTEYITVLGKKFQIRLPEEKKEVYLRIASQLDELMQQEKKNQKYSYMNGDDYVAIRVAFMLAVENMELKEEFKNCLSLVEKADEKLNSFLN